MFRAVLDWVLADRVLLLQSGFWPGSADREDISRGEENPWEAAGPGTCRGRETALEEKSFESSPPPSRTRVAAGAWLEGRGSRANFKPSACPSLPATGSRPIHSIGKGPFPDGRPYLPSRSPCSAPRRQPFPARWVSGLGLWEAHYHPLGFPSSQSAPSGEDEEIWWGCLSLLPALAERRVAQTCLLARGSLLECAPSAGPPSLHSSLCGPAPPPSAGGRGGETLGLGNGACTGRARASRPRLEGCSTLPTPEFGCSPTPCPALFNGQTEVGASNGRPPIQDGR